MKPLHFALTVALTLGVGFAAGASPINDEGPKQPGALPSDPGAGPGPLPTDPVAPPATKSGRGDRAPRGKVPAEKPPATEKPPAPPTLEERVAALEAENAALRKVIQITGNTVTVAAKGPLVLDVAGLHVKTSHDVKMMVGRKFEIKAASTAELKASSTLDLAGSTVTLNNGTKRAARVGSPIAGSQVTDGAPSVLVP